MTPDGPRIDWGEALAAHGGWLRLTILARLRDRNAADEVMQEVALAAVAQKAPHPRRLEGRRLAPPPGGPAGAALSPRQGAEAPPDRPPCRPPADSRRCHSRERPARLARAATERAALVRSALERLPAGGRDPAAEIRRGLELSRPGRAIGADRAGRRGEAASREGPSAGRTGRRIGPSRKGDSRATDRSGRAGPARRRRGHRGRAPRSSAAWRRPPTAGGAWPWRSWRPRAARVPAPRSRTGRPRRSHREGARSAVGPMDRPRGRRAGGVRPGVDEPGPGAPRAPLVVKADPGASRPIGRCRLFLAPGRSRPVCALRAGRAPGLRPRAAGTRGIPRRAAALPGAGLHARRPPRGRAGRGGKGPVRRETDDLGPFPPGSLSCGIPAGIPVSERPRRGVGLGASSRRNPRCGSRGKSGRWPW